MSSAPVSTASLTPEQKAEFQRLTRAPALAWVTVSLCAMLVLTFATSYWLSIVGVIPLWVGTIVNSLVGYVAFSVGHDSIHRSISSNTKLNDAIGQIGLTLVLPYVDLRMFRWAHILHHRFASGPKDPDIVLHGAWWTLPFRWMLIDVIYFVHAVRHSDKVSGPYLRASLRNAAIVALVIAAAIYAGYGDIVLMLWFLPSRLILLMLGFSFFWLPHVPHDTTQEENFTRATAIRQGHEWLFAPALQYQNYHLIHHLFPMTPFYNNYKVWKLLEPELRTKDLAVQHGFSIRPTIYPGRPTQP